MKQTILFIAIILLTLVSIGATFKGVPSKVIPQQQVGYYLSEQSSEKIKTMISAGWIVKEVESCQRGYYVLVIYTK